MHTDEEYIVRYLLNELAEEECVQIEDAIEDQPSMLDTISAIEDDLILSYLRAELADDRRERFEECYLSSPAKRARVESARVLRQAAGEVALSRKSRYAWFPFDPRFRWAFAAVTILVVVLSLPFVWRKAARGTDSGQSVIAMNPVSFTLTPGLARGGTTQQIGIPSNADRVRLDLVVDMVESHSGYLAVLGTPEAPQLLSIDAVYVSPNRIGVNILSQQLPSGDYTLKLKAVGGHSEDIATYFFRVVR